MWRASESKIAGIRALLILSAVLFFSGACIGLWGFVVPRSSKNEHGFTDGLRSIFENWRYLEIVVATGLATVSVFPRERHFRLSLEFLALVGLSLFVYAGLRAKSELGLGYVLYERAQVYVVALVAVVIVLCIRFLGSGLISKSPVKPLFLVLPLLAVAAVDASDTMGWKAYLGVECAELKAQDTSADPAFFRSASSNKYGINWTYPAVSVLLRSAASHAILIYPGYTGWQPFDPKTAVPDIDDFKADGGFCR